VNGQLVLDPTSRVAPDIELSIEMAAPRPRNRVSGFRVAFEDRHLIVIEKPPGISSVPYERSDTGTALDLIRGEWRAQARRATQTPLRTVHRLDKETSGLLCFAKTRLAERGLHQVFQRHLARRTYLALAHGAVQAGRIESRLVPDRGDGLRGSARNSGEGQHAVTHVEVLERGVLTTYCRIRLETGRTHQIRIHLAEAGRPLIGDQVYTRDLWRSGEPVLPAPRLMLHAATLAFDHPVTGEAVDLSASPMADFLDVLRGFGHRGSPA
jgi:23S rRNA pseudouridine1911/1915/1917 synthase